MEIVKQGYHKAQILQAYIKKEKGRFHGFKEGRTNLPWEIIPNYSGRRSNRERCKLKNNITTSKCFDYSRQLYE